jgi:hypothetical protein
LLGTDEGGIHTGDPVLRRLDGAVWIGQVVE